LPQDDFIRLCPCIYQQKIKKQYEVRAVFFGAEVLAIKLDSQARSITSTDWRIGNPAKMDIAPILIPEDIYLKCRDVMEKLGIVHGSFDFAVDDENRWVFFEVNEAGQFLWLETYAPSLPILEFATQFLERPSKDFRADRLAVPIKVAEICRTREYCELLELDKENVESLEMTAML